MIPLRDSIATRRAPVVNYAIIGLSALAFLAQLQTDPGEPSLVETYGMIPQRVTHPDQPVEIAVSEERVMTPQGSAIMVKRREAAPSAVAPVITLLTCIFLDGGWMHLLGNMWFLHILGDNVEDRFGRVG